MDELGDKVVSAFIATAFSQDTPEAGFRKRIQHVKIVIPQAFDNESFFQDHTAGRFRLD